MNQVQLPILNFCTFHSLVSASCPFTRAVISDVGILAKECVTYRIKYETVVRIAGEVNLFITAVEQITGYGLSE